MTTITVPTKNDVDDNAKALFDQLTKQLGKLPNLYSVMGYSASTLKGFLQFEAALGAGTYSVKEKEAINLIVSQINECDYCLAAHTMIAKLKGYTKEDILGFRKGIATDPKLQLSLKIAQSVAMDKGKVPPALLEEFFGAGFTASALIEIIGLVTAKIFTNYVFASTHVPLDFPAADPLD